MDLSSNPTTRQTQLTAIKNYVEANHSVNGVGVYDQSTANAMNAAAAPDFYVWRTSVSQQEIDEAVDWSEVVGLTTNELLSFSVLKASSMLNPSLASIRAAFGAIFPANQQPNTNAGLLAVAKRLATIAEKTLATGTGSQASPATMGDGAEGLLTVQNLLEAEANG